MVVKVNRRGKQKPGPTKGIGRSERRRNYFLSFFKKQPSHEHARFLTAVSVMVGTCIGAGFLGIPYVAAQAGFWVMVGYLLLFGLMIVFVNLFFGEVILRNRGNHQLSGFAEIYLGKRSKKVMFFFLKVSIISALLAYMIGVGQGVSFLIFGNFEHEIALGALFAFVMAGLIWKGIESLKQYERIGVLAIFILFIGTMVFFSRDIRVENLFTFNPVNIFVPIGVILFSLIEVYSLPEIKIILRRREDLMKKAIIVGTIIPIIFYFFFALVVVGSQGANTPEIATFSLGKIFIIIGMVAMFTSYLTLGISLQRNYLVDYQKSRVVSWLWAAIFPITLFLLMKFFDFFSFITVLTIGGLLGGTVIVFLVLMIKEKAQIKKSRGGRKPEYKIKASKLVIWILAILFGFGLVVEILKMFNILG